MRLKLIACNVLSREIGFLSSQSDNFIDITYLRQGYHDTPEELNRILQHEIDLIDSGDSPYSCLPKNGDFDAILLGYGLCCNGPVGVASKKYPIVIPKAHDCITLLLGSKERYLEYFETYPGTFWYTPGWCENLETRRMRRDRLMQEYTERYGEENAEYLVDMECSWDKDYQNVIYINWDGFPFPDYSPAAREIAQESKLAFQSLSGGSALIEDFLAGKWDDRFLVLQPGEALEPSYDADVVRTAKKKPE